MQILGCLGYYTNEELMKDENLQYISKVLRKKHFDIKNGNAKVRINRDIHKMQKARAVWEIHAHIADDAWNEATKKFPASNTVSLAALIFSLLLKSPDTKKYYGFNENKLQSYLKSVTDQQHSFSSLRTANKLLEMLDFQIAHFYTKAKQLEKVKM